MNLLFPKDRTERDSVYDRKPPTRLVSRRLRKSSRPYASPLVRAASASAAVAAPAPSAPWPPPPLRSGPTVPLGKRAVPHGPPLLEVGSAPRSPARVSLGKVPGTQPFTSRGVAPIGSLMSKKPL